jgi:hypothetical protein
MNVGRQRCVSQASLSTTSMRGKGMEKSFARLLALASSTFVDRHW